MTIPVPCLPLTPIGKASSGGHGGSLLSNGVSGIPRLTEEGQPVGLKSSRFFFLWLYLLLVAVEVLPLHTPTSQACNQLVCTTAFDRRKP